LGWVTAAAETTDGFLTPSALAHLRLPVVVLSAEQELFVDNRRQQDIVEMLPNAKLVPVANAKHEILMETDEVRAQLWFAFDELADQAAPRRS
jgi:lysophospholipase